MCTANFLYTKKFFECTYSFVCTHTHTHTENCVYFLHASFERIRIISLLIRFLLTKRSGSFSTDENMNIFNSTIVVIVVIVALIVLIF